jgi:hypothetical protein
MRNTFNAEAAEYVLGPDPNAFGNSFGYSKWPEIHSARSAASAFNVVLLPRETSGRAGAESAMVLGQLLNGIATELVQHGVC